MKLSESELCREEPLHLLVLEPGVPSSLASFQAQVSQGNLDPPNQVMFT